MESFPLLPQHLVMFESELRAMVDDAATWNGSETGGDLFGYFTRCGRPVVQFATPPGPNAKHAVAQFAQDLEYFELVSRRLMAEFGLQYLGDWHSHHRLRLDPPSTDDVERIAGFAKRNRFQTMAEVIITYD